LAQNYAAPRTADGQPDQGIWELRNAANWDLLEHTGGYKIPAGLGVVEGGEIPYKLEALAHKEENFTNRLTGDPVEKCYLAGFPPNDISPISVSNPSNARRGCDHFRICSHVAVDFYGAIPSIRRL
jgi:hypothetical protein